MPLRTLLASLVEGDRIAEILEDFPALTEEDVRTIAFAATSAEEALPVAHPSVNTLPS